MVKNLTYCLFIIFLLSCDRMPDEYPCDNLKDPDCSGYIKPYAQITSPSSNNVFDTNRVIISWTSSWKGGNVSTFSYRLSSSATWSAWLNTNSALYNCLVDGDYIFYILEQYPTGDIQADASAVSFTIDHIYGPCIVLTDQCIETTQNSNFDLFITLEEIENILGAFFSISFDQNMLNIIETEALSSILSSSADNLVYITTPIAAANANGLIEINMARFGGSAGSNDLNQLVRMKFQALTEGNTAILINSNSSLRDENNDTIDVLKLINANIEIQ